MANFTKSWRAEVGLNHTPAYQVSGRPFASGSIDARAKTSSLNLNSQMLLDGFMLPIMAPQIVE